MSLNYDPLKCHTNFYIHLHISIKKKAYSVKKMSILINIEHAIQIKILLF